MVKIGHHISCLKPKICRLNWQDNSPDESTESIQVKLLYYDVYIYNRVITNSRVPKTTDLRGV